VARLSIFDEVGQEVARRYDVRGVPTFLVFDDQGNLVGRDLGVPDRHKIKTMIASS